MFEKFKDASCLAFYSSYDRFMKNYLPHSVFFDFIRERFSRISNVDDACEQLNCIFFDFLSGTISENTHASEVQKDSFVINKEIFDYCYEKHYNERVPENCNEIKERILSDENSYELFSKISKYQLEHKLDKKRKIALEEFRFIQAFSGFIHEKGKVEDIDYFKRFLFIYPFEEKQINEDKKAIKERQFFLDVLKKDKIANKEDLKKARDWYKKQLGTVNFGNLTEQEKSSFFKEMFVAFGNISSEKTGGLKGYIIQIKNLLYLGRYYNIHHLPLEYIKWNKDDIRVQKKIFLLAYGTWLSLCGIHPLSDLDKAQKNKKDHIPSMVLNYSIFGRKGPRLKVDEVLKQESYGELINEQDINLLQLNLGKIMKHLSLRKVAEMVEKGTSREVAIPIIIKDVFQKAGLEKFFDDKTKKEIVDYLGKMQKNDCSEYFFSNFATRNDVILNKPGIGLLTHYDIHLLNKNNESNTSKNQELLRDTSKLLF